jgi:tetratricopeptide (TPR) repeat protein
MLLGAEYLAFGMEPGGYHLVSLALYTLNTAVQLILTIVLLARCRTGGARGGAGPMVLGASLAVAMFAVHPLRAEVVAWASCQPYLPCALFSMLTVLAYLHAIPPGMPPRRGWLVVSFGLLVAAMLSKAAAVSLPLILMILDVYPLRRLGGGPGQWLGASSRRVLLEKLPFVAVSLVFTGLAIRSRVEERNLVSDPRSTFSARIAQACYGIWFYPIKTLLPSDITADYAIPESMGLESSGFALRLVAVLALSVALFLLRHRWPAALAIWLSYLAFLAPNLGFFRIGEQVVAYRFSYLSMIGIVVLVAAGLGDACSAAGRRWRSGASLTLAATLGILAALIPLTRAQCRSWLTTESLWTYALNHGSNRSPLVHNNLGVVFVSQGQLEAAKTQFTQALRLDPDYVAALNNSAMIWATAADPRFRDGRRAVEAATHTCELTEWRNPVYLDTLASAYAEAGDFESATRWQTHAIELLTDKATRDDFRSRLALYQKRKPYHEVPKGL